MHGCGNDYIFVEQDSLPTNISLSELAQRISHRHTGVGSDGLVVIGVPEKEDAHLSMRIFNADGSEAEMCGNAARCVARYAQLHPRLCAWAGQGEPLYLQTGGGVRTLFLRGEGLVCVNMGRAQVEPLRFEAANHTWEAMRVEVGNPHCVIVADALTDELVHTCGPQIENLTTVFPHRTNVEFITLQDEHHIRMRVWERGSGETEACGTGATAAAVAAVQQGLAAFPVEVQLRGGTLIIDQSASELTMTGPAEPICEGEWMI